MCGQCLIQHHAHVLRWILSDAIFPQAAGRHCLLLLRWNSQGTLGVHGGVGVHKEVPRRQMRQSAFAEPPFKPKESLCASTRGPIDHAK